MRTKDDMGPIRQEPDFDLRQLEVFSKVVELGSISKAGLAVGLAQASVSERMANLEVAIGIPLLDRLGRRIVPTKAGAILYEQAQAHLALKRTTCQILEEFLGLRRGEIMIGGSTIPGEYILPRLIADFRRQHEAAVVRLNVEDSLRVCERVLAGLDEFGIVGYFAPRPHLVSTELWQDELVLVVPPSHRWVGGPPVSLDELAREPYIQREGGSGTRAKLQADLEALGWHGSDQFNVVAQLGSSTAVKEAVKHGLGVSILSARAVDGDLRAHALAIVPIAGVKFPRMFYLIRDERRTMAPMAALLAEYLAQPAPLNTAIPG